MALALPTVEKRKFLSVIPQYSAVLLPTVRLRYVPLYFYTCRAVLTSIICRRSPALLIGLKSFNQR